LQIVFWDPNPHKDRCRTWHALLMLLEWLYRATCGVWSEVRLSHVLWLHVCSKSWVLKWSRETAGK
jgi:hypothetical protein